MTERGLALAFALVLDAWLGDRGGRGHPVALAGRLLEWGCRPWRGRGSALELAGGGAALAAVGGLAALLGWSAERLVGRMGRGRLLRGLLLGLLLKQTFAVRSLLEEGGRVREALDRGRLTEARARLRSLVSRPTEALGPSQCASAAIESLAENLGDSVAAPLFCYCLLGLPGAAFYRVVNTADAMFGYRGETEWLGKSAARLDDALNWLPARLATLALIGAALLLGGAGSAGRALRLWQRDGGCTRSPNSGRPMAAMAGALGRRLEKPGHHVLGNELPPASAADLELARRLVAAAAALLAGAAFCWEARR